MDDKQYSLDLSEVDAVDAIKDIKNRGWGSVLVKIIANKIHGIDKTETIRTKKQ